MGLAYFSECDCSPCVFLTTLAFLIFAEALLLLWREREVVFSMRGFSSSLATRWLSYSLTLSE